MHYKKRIRTPTKREIAQASYLYSSFCAPASGKAPPPRPEILDKPQRTRKPASARVGPSEHQEQCAVIDWWWLVHTKYHVPHFALFAVPNGGARDAITGARLREEGVRSGALDLVLAKPSGPYHGLFLELKIGNNKPSDNQKAFIDYLTSAGYKASVHWSAESAIAEIVAYLGDPS